MYETDVYNARTGKWEKVLTHHNGFPYGAIIHGEARSGIIRDKVVK